MNIQERWLQRHKGLQQATSFFTIKGPIIHYDIELNP